MGRDPAAKVQNALKYLSFRIRCIIKPVKPLQTNTEAQSRVSQVADDPYGLFMLFLFGLIVICWKCCISLEPCAGLPFSSQCFQESFYDLASLEKDKHNMLLSCILNYIPACFCYHFKRLFYFYIIKSLALWGLFMIPFRRVDMKAKRNVYTDQKICLRGWGSAVVASHPIFALKLTKDAQRLNKSMDIRWMGFCFQKQEESLYFNMCTSCSSSLTDLLNQFTWPCCSFCSQCCQPAAGYSIWTLGFEEKQKQHLTRAEIRDLDH